MGSTVAWLREALGAITMYLSNLKLWNFRKYGTTKENLDLGKPNLEVPFTQGLNVLIGENDSGKTAIIDAIKLVLDTHSGEWTRLTPEDFWRGTNRLRIECRFDGLSDSEAMHFTEWLGMEGEGEKAKPYLKVLLDVTNTSSDGRLHYDIRAGTDDEGHRLEAEARDYLRATYLKPLRDAKSELIPRRNSRLSQILSGLTAFKGKTEHELAKVSMCFECLLRKYFKQDHRDETCQELQCPYTAYFYTGEGGPNEGADIRTSLKTMLDDFFGHSNYEATFGVMNRKLRNILEQFKLSLSDEELGLGSHNLLFIAAELLNLRRDKWTGLRLALIEELEAHLHPQRQMRIVEYLQENAETERTTDTAAGARQKDGKNAAKDGFQVILTTHSPNLGSKVRLKNLIICHGSQVLPMGPAYTQLREPDYAFLERFLDVTKANLFFAEGVILVEGPSEELILPALARKIGMDLTQKGVSIVNVGSKAFLRYAKIFQRKDGRQMDIPVAVVTDLDIKPGEENTKSNSTTRKDAKKKSLAEKYNGQKVKTFISPHWTLEYCLARSKTLSPLLYEAIKGAIDEMREDDKSIATIADPYETFSKGRTQEDIAFELYQNQIVKRHISKPSVAQHLAQSIKEAHLSEADLADDDSTGYLINAIKYATSDNNNP